jgi:hypothetical protein
MPLTHHSGILHRTPQSGYFVLLDDERRTGETVAAAVATAAADARILQQCTFEPQPALLLYVHSVRLSRHIYNRFPLKDVDDAGICQRATSLL